MPQRNNWFTENKIKAISFDLDDTLWDNKPVIIGAERALWGWFDLNAPRITHRYTMKEMIELRRLVMKKYPELANDLTALRIKSIQFACEQVGEDPQLAYQAFDFFIQERNRIFIAPEVFDALGELKKNFKLCAITNGNSDIKRVGLDKYFEFSISPAQAGVQKPESRIFDMAAERLNISPQQIAHVGDSLESDVKGANLAGYKSIWFKNSDAHEQQAMLVQSSIYQPHLEIQQLSELL